VAGQLLPDAIDQAVFEEPSLGQGVCRVETTITLEDGLDTRSLTGNFLVVARQAALTTDKAAFVPGGAIIARYTGMTGGQQVTGTSIFDCFRGHGAAGSARSAAAPFG